MEKKLQKHLDKLTLLNNERRSWLLLSAFVVATILGIIFEWEIVTHSKIVWLTGSLGLLVSMGWWYWTMRLIRHILDSKKEEYELLTDVIFLIREVQMDVKNLRE